MAERRILSDGREEDRRKLSGLKAEVVRLEGLVSEGAGQLVLRVWIGTLERGWKGGRCFPSLDGLASSTAV